jgi:hypothetical protein
MNGRVEVQEYGALPLMAMDAGMLIGSPLTHGTQQRQELLVYCDCVLL